MRISTLAVAFALGSATAPVLAATAPMPAPPQTIVAAEAKAHVGQTVVIDAIVGGVHRAASGRTVLIDMNGRFPNNALTAVIFQSDVTKFANLEALSGKPVRITGTIKLYNGRPEIVLNNPSQLKLRTA